MHKSVLVKEIIDSLHINSQSRIIDATLGAGGHTQEIVKRGAKVLGVETDPKMLEIARKNLESFKDRVIFAKGNFKDIDSIAKNNNFEKVDAILFDLGISSFHIDDFKRGFSFRERESLLDMRLDPDSLALKGSDLLNTLREDQLKELFSVSITEPDLSRLVRKIINYRIQNLIKTVGQFKEIVDSVSSRGRSLIPSTLAFMAVRIAVNSELDVLSQALPKAYSLLKKDGKLLIISFHSGEDSIVKKFFKKEGILIIPTKEEIDENSRARSAKLRILTKT
ncbi:MAG: 16S rRNA (cytosine(1402)-N(4))-methyltransferase RsmH [Candidatus Woesebacteria bacterium]|nr:MAG: 16S rRNA (cytosine(1402)-N(4))-methyltransferase RsmH [Candidatus Woesebacteria bacterium]